MLIGLTATPDKKTPEDQIIFRYPLAAAIADSLVKTPVIVGRKDDRKDPTTKLSDGVTLLRAKEKALTAYTSAHGRDPVNPVMLVVAKETADADEYGAILRSSEFFGGAYADAVLVVHSKQPDAALAELATVEDPTSTVRIIISVGMLKEGWDVKNVYVIVSMRASVSDILTEQTLGRGMRLPFEAYTDIEILDTLEVVAHERYEDLLKKAGALNKAFIDYRTWAATRTNAHGQTVVVTQTAETSLPPIIGSAGEASVDDALAQGTSAVVTVAEERTATATAAAKKIKRTIEMVAGAPLIEVPVLQMTAVKNPFTLADITDTAAFRKLGASLAANPESELSRTLVSARVVTGADGIKRTELVRSTAADRIKTQSTLFPIEELRKQLVDLVLNSPSVPARRKELAAVGPLIDAFLAGLGTNAVDVLSANLDRAGARLVQLVMVEQRRFQSKPTYDEVLELRPFTPTRVTDRDESVDHLGPFSRSIAYDGWKRALFPLAWFDSEPERAVANMVDDDDSVTAWVRLHLNDLPILWNSAGQNYNPDLIVIGTDGMHAIVEVKMNKEMKSEDVLSKREAAQRWANHVNADDKVKAKWCYLLVSEADVKTAKGSWDALQRLGS